MKGPKVDYESSISNFHDLIFSKGKNQSLENLERETPSNLNFALSKENKIATSPIFESNDSPTLNLDKKMTTHNKCNTYIGLEANTGKKSIFKELKKINIVKKALNKMRKNSTLNKKNQLTKLHYQIIGDISHIQDHKHTTKENKYKVV